MGHAAETLEETPQSDLEILHEELQDASNKMFEEYGKDLKTELSGPSGRCNWDDRWLVAVIGFSSPGACRGSLSLLLQRDLVQQTHPSKATDPEAIEDWAAELSNQMLGRLKNQLLRYGLTLYLATPSTIAGSSFRLGKMTEDSSQWFELRDEREETSAYVVMSVALETSLSLAENEGSGDVQEEGELLLF